MLALFRVMHHHGPLHLDAPGLLGLVVAQVVEVHHHLEGFARSLLRGQVAPGLGVPLSLDHLLALSLVVRARDFALRLSPLQC